MRNFHKIHLEGAGGVIGDIALEAISVAFAQHCKVSFPFNGVKVNVDYRSDWKYVAEKAIQAVQDCTKEIYC